MTVIDHDLVSGVNGPGVRPTRKGFDIGTDHTMTRSEYAVRTRNVAAIGPVAPAPSSPALEPETGAVLSVAELLALVRRDPTANLAWVTGAIEQLRHAGFDDEGVVRVLLGEGAHERPDSAEGRLLRYLGEHGTYESASGRCVFELANLLDVSSSTMTKVLIDLAKRGRVVRAVSNAGTTKVALP